MIKSGKSDLLGFLNSHQVDQVPEGWLTAKQLAEMAGKSHVRVQAQLREGVEKGIVLTKKFRIMAGSTARPVPHYRLKK